MLRALQPFDDARALGVCKARTPGIRFESTLQQLANALRRPRILGWRPLLPLAIFEQCL